MQASPSSPEAGGGYATRRGHVPQLSISDPSHHVTEAIGHMYDDDYDQRDSRRLSYISSPLSESISIVPQNRPASGSSSSSNTLQVQNHLDGGNHPHVNGQTRPSVPGGKALDASPTTPSSTTSPMSPDTANTSFPPNDLDYESNPAAVAQELSNLAAIRRMSMDVAATDDPDLPSFGNFTVPSIAPSPSADENDTSRLFWVPARLHPELAPKEFKSFLESKAEHIKRTSGDFSSLSPEGQGVNGSLRRKRSMLSRQIDNPQGYTDGAERLERKRSQNKDHLGPSLQELGSLADDSEQRIPSNSSILDGVQSLRILTEEDRPILPPAPPGHSLRRSTRTQYRKAGSLRKGERPPYPKRLGRTSDTSETLESPVGIDSMVDHSHPTKQDSSLGDAGGRVAAPEQSHPRQSRANANGRSTLSTQYTDQNIPEIVETPPLEASTGFSSPSQSAQDPSLPAPIIPEQSAARRPSNSPTQPKDIPSTLNEIANNPQPLPGNSTRTDSLSFIPTLSEDRKAESKKSKDKKDSEGGRKSSWHWFLGSEDKEKEKEKEKKKDKDSEPKKIRNKIADKVQDTANSLQSSVEPNPRRESAVFDRLDPKLEEERKKDNARRSSGESKKEKESGLFSSIFGGGRRKNSEHHHHHKKSLSRTLSPDPPVRELRPDIDYPWTRFSILEERAIYRMAHIKLANPRRALYSQVLLSNFMYSYLAKVQQMQPHMMISSSSNQRQQKARDQPDEYLQYQKYQEYSDSSYDDPQMYDYNDDPHNHYQQHSRGSKHQGYENGNAYGPGHYQYGSMSFSDDVQLDDDDDDMW
ncbi:hypothetical protein P175DRAFT_0109450 [Aspergillus ochraceoroseus IBT 24754]|uniref:Protein Zds1 C-terminal domain-containing protein n=1 Tax=Aspergillus ochraceoroseus IBT 24754 TaxID=1392256 RepID=A0A2T5LL65_9EURO|nr:uncharacterized protein P175DRAFT_0109450 [Aspergillus ochraceoroseus IBT 24754]PTU17023.1 hypothetical protein P175DRAFT_0109450 [Aspergillus ochraceoroseus IBT 24754]